MNLSILRDLYFGGDNYQITLKWSFIVLNIQSYLEAYQALNQDSLNIYPKVIFLLKYLK